MINYISLLRGINVSGQKKIKMADLRKIYEDLELKNVKSYVQSGNVVFQSDVPPDILSAKIELAIEAEYDFSVPVFVYSSGLWQQIKGENPFADDYYKESKFFHVTFLAEMPDKNLISELEGQDFGADEYRIVDNIVYLYCPNGYGRTKLNNNFWERKLKVSATTRNWNTIKKLLELVEENASKTVSE